MRNNTALRPLTARLFTAPLTAALACAALSVAVTAQTVPVAPQSGEKPARFGSSLKRPKAEAAERSKGNAAEDDAPRPEDVVRVDTSLVNLDVLVTEAGGQRYVNGLTKDDFVLTEDGRPQAVTSVTVGDDAARLPRSIVLIFDRSQSEFPFLDASIEAAKALVDQLAPTDEMAVVTDDVELAAPFTKDKKKLKQTLDSLKKLTVRGYNTRSMQFSALLATVRELIDAERRRPIIIFQTDGDEAARLEHAGPAGYDLNTVFSEVEKSRAKIYTVIPNTRLIDVPPEEFAARFAQMEERMRVARSKYKDMYYGMQRVPPKAEGDSSAGMPEGMRERVIQMISESMVRGQTAAARVADLTGGWTSFIERQEQVGEIYARILADINHRYVVSYYPSNRALDGKLRKVHVEVKGHPEYTVQGRTSYYASRR